MNEREEMILKLSFLKRATSLLCAIALLAGCFAGVTVSISAAGASLGYWPEPLAIPNQFYYENETLQPYGSCFLIDELKNWSPDNDPDARYNRGSIALRDRWMGPNVNPLASRDAKVMPLAMANARASEAPSQGGDGDFVYAFNNFQYVDIYNFWGGSSSEGPIAIPSPEVIDSAHRNGVPATGTIFIPWGDSAYGNQFVKEMVEKDENGHFIAADKLIEIAQYYGFDGYIFNAESGTGVAGFKEFLTYLQENKPDNFTISWYNGSGSLSAGSIKSWMQDGDTRITDEWWLDMSGNGNVDGTIAAAQQTGVNPWNIHSTWEYWPMAGNAKGGRYQTRLDADGLLKCSLGILAPTTSLTSSKDSNDFINVQDQKLWVGPSLDPSSTYRPEYEFCGFANLVADRTPIIGTDFATTFTTGNGYRFYENGAVVGKENGWYNRSLTDVLPTWRWIIDSEGQKLSAKIDFDDAWYAGTSLKLSGAMDAGKANHVKLYSCQLDLTAASKFSITYKTGTAGVDLSLGLCFGDTYDDGNFKFYPVTTTANGEWTTATVDLSADAGKRAIAISLKLSAPEGVSDYALNVGRMAITTDETAPAATTQVTLDEVIYPTDKTMEARVYWEKASNAFMYRIFRVHADGSREFVGATPSDAFYLGSFEKDGSEKSCKFEITSYSENGIKGGTQTFEIDWPAEVKDGFVPYFDEGENIALKMPAVSSVRTADDGSARLINDGVIPQSKWCADTTRGYAVIDLGENKTIQRWVVYHANCKGAGESVDMNTVCFDLQYAPDDGKPLLTGDDNESRTRVAALTYTKADEVTGNKQDVTDRNLDAPITARYVKLNVTQSDNSAWHAIRIYEFELYEKACPYGNTASPYERNVSVRNNAGAADTVVVDNVPMIYSSGTYSDKNGTFHEDTGKVRLFKDLTSAEPIAVVSAVQPNESYKQRGVGIAKFENLELDPNGGRLFYDVLDGSSGVVKNSRRASVAYAPESGTAIKAPSGATLTRTTGGEQLRKQYATFTATGIEEGAVIKIFASETADSPILHTLPAKADGIITQSRVPLEKEGGKVYYEIHKEGKPDSERYALEYADPMTLTADPEGLNQLIARCAAVRQADCTTATWPAFSEALASARTVAAGTPTGTQAEAARTALAEAYAALRFRNSAQRLGELCELFEQTYQESHYTADSFKTFRDTLTEAKAMVSGYDSSAYQVEQMRIRLEAAVRGLVEGSGGVTGVIVTPATVALDKGSSGFKFSATVEGEGEISQEVTWTVTGNTDDFTQMVRNTLYVGPNETSATLTVTATSVTDPTVSGTAIVTVNGNGGEQPEPPTPGDSKLLSSGAEILGTGSTKGTIASEGANYAFDGDYSTKWCSEQTPNWVVFDIKTAANPDRLKITHAGGATPPEDERFNTNDFALQILNTAKISEEEFLAKSETERAAIMGDDNYWTEIKGYKANEANVTDDPLTVEGNIRLFRFVVTDGDDNWWQGPDTLRIYEIEVYGKKAGAPAEEIAVSITPETMKVERTPGQKGQFTATVTGTDNVEVTWSISGNVSEGTMITNGQLFIGEGEKAGTLTVTATSVADPTKSATATVTVVDPTYTVTVDASVTNGTVTPSAGEATEGTEITLTVTPAEGYRLRTGTLKVNGTVMEDLKFTMPGENAYIPAEFVKIADLQTAIAQAADLTESAYTSSSWAEVARKLAAAQTVLNRTDASQTEIDAAANALTAAVNALVYRGDKSELNALIAEVEALNEEDYTPATWAGLAEKLAAAKTVAGNADAVQSEIDAAKEALAAARDALLARADKTALNERIAEAEALDENGYTEESWAKLAEALAAAKTVAEDANAAQDAVDAAAAALADAKAGLEARVTVNKDALNALIAQAEALDENGYTEESWAKLAEALEAAKTVSANPDATQEEVNAAGGALEKALEALEASGNADALTKLIEDAKKEDLSKLTDKSAAEIRDAIAKAEEVIAKRGTQEKLDEAYAALKSALDHAAKKEAPKTPSTGDEMQLLLPLVGMMSAAALAAVTVLNKKKHAR